MQGRAMPADSTDAKFTLQAQRWYYFPRVTSQETLLFRQYDTREERSVALACPSLGPPTRSFLCRLCNPPLTTTAAAA